MTTHNSLSMRVIIETSSGLEQIISSSTKESLTDNMIQTICNDLKRFINLSFNGKHLKGKKDHWHVPWV